jgi:hypothetical protein
MSAIATPLYYVNGRQHLNSDVKMNNICTEIISSETVTLKGNSISLDGKNIALSSKDIALSSHKLALDGNDIALSGKDIALSGNCISLNGRINMNGVVAVTSLYMSDIATQSSSAMQSITMTDKLAIFNKENKLLVYDLSSSDNYTSFGGHSMENNKTAWGSTAFGYNALKSISARTDISFANTAVGSNAMSQLITGKNNTSVGYHSLANISQGSSNVAIGSNALKTTSTGSCNTVIGYNSDTLKGSESNINIVGSNNTTAFSNVNIIGSNINALASNKTYINNVDNLSGKQVKSLSVYDPNTNEFGYASDIIQKCVNSQKFISQQCIPLTSIYNYGKSKQGYSCAYSCKYPNNSIIVVGGPYENGGIGAVWVWVLNNEMATCSNIQKLVCDDASTKMFGRAVAISYDTNTICVSASDAIIIWSRQNVLLPFTQTQKIVSSSLSLSLSDDGSILLIGEEVWNKVGAEYQKSQMLINDDIKREYKSTLSSDNSTIAVADSEGICIFTFTKTNNTWIQQGQKMVVQQGTNLFSRIYLSSNGNILAFGNRIYTRSGMIWKREDDIIENTILSMTSDGNTLVCNDGTIWYSVSVSNTISNTNTKYIKKQSLHKHFDSAVISRNGNTMIVGDTGYKNDTGTVYLYFKERINMYINNANANGVCATLSSYKPILQHTKLTMEGYCSLALSGDGSTLSVINKLGDIFIYKKNGKTWQVQQTQIQLQGAKETQRQIQECSLNVALSFDGNTLAISDPQDNEGVGAVWIYKLLLNEYVIQGEKIVPSDNFGAKGNIGSSISLSYDGNTIAIGASKFNPNGASWVYTYNNSDGVYIQQGLRIVGSTSSTTPCFQGSSISLAGDGNTLVIGGINMAWIYYKSNHLWYLLNSISGNGKSISISKDGSMLAIGSNIYKRNIGINSNSKYSLFQTIEIEQAQIVISGDGMTLGVLDSNTDDETYLYMMRRHSETNLFYNYSDKIVYERNISSSSHTLSYDGNTIIAGTNVMGANVMGTVYIYNTNPNIQTTYTKQNTGYTSIGTIVPTAPLTVESNGISSCIDMYGSSESGGSFQRFFSNPNSWWNVGTNESNGSFHIRNQRGTGIYINSGDQSWREYSDKKLQTNIEQMDISGAYNKLLQLNPVTYQCVSEDMKKKSGLLAEDVLPLFPQAVSKNDGYYGIGYTELIPYLIAGMKQQSTIISQQQKEIEALKSAFEIRLKEL